MRNREPSEEGQHENGQRPGVAISLAIAGGTLLVLGLGGVLFLRSAARANNVALASSPKGVTAVKAVAAAYRASRRYVGTIEPWVEARLGPQITSAYVDTVLVRPGASVRRGQVVATLDCRNASAESKAVAMKARSIDAEQAALAHQAERVGGLLDGGFVSPNEAEQKKAESLSKQAELLSTQARLARASLEVNDCILRAPFDGEVADRALDPGAFARPGMAVVTLIDRRTVRIVADVPENDFPVVAPDSPVTIHAVATGLHLVGKIARRSPAADPSTRTVHFEIDVPDANRSLPVGTTAELDIDVGAAEPATEIPLMAASVRRDQATLFTVSGGKALKAVVAVRGEIAGNLFVEPALRPGTLVVTEGRSALKDGDAVTVQVGDFDGTSADRSARHGPPSAAAPAERASGGSL